MREKSKFNSDGIDSSIKKCKRSCSDACDGDWRYLRLAPLHRGALVKRFAPGPDPL
jgi:hypothetical protein